MLGQEKAVGHPVVFGEQVEMLNIDKFLLMQIAKVSWQLKNHMHMTCLIPCDELLAKDKYIVYIERFTYDASHGPWSW
jgi:hypothetical protein